MFDNDNNNSYEPKDSKDSNDSMKPENSTEPKDPEDLKNPKESEDSSDSWSQPNTDSSPKSEEESGPVSSQNTDAPESGNEESVNTADSSSAGTQENPYQGAGAGQNQDYGQQYQNPQNPQNYYSPYGQYGNSQYGQYNNPYGNQNSYGGYNGNQYNQNQYNPYNQNPYQQQGQQGQQYWSYQKYGGQYQQNPQPPKHTKGKNTGLKVFLWILGVLIVGSVVGFCIYGVYTAIDQKNTALPGTSSAQPGKNNGAFGGTQNSASSSLESQIEGAAPGNGTNPNAAGIVINSQPTGDELSAKQVYKEVVQSVVGVETEVTDTSTGESGTGQGTGIIATSDGYILTNAHVVNYSRSNKVTVILYNKKEYAATVVGYDKTSDISVLKINATGLTPATFGNADQLEVGDQVIAIGNPGGLNYASSLTGGYVSALNRTIESHSDNGMTYIQTDAAINPGNSGGPLVNMYGQVVGINSNKIVATGFEGMGFSIPISKAKSIIDDLVARGYVTGRSRLGITATTITDAQAQLSGLPAGVIIREVTADSDLRKSNVGTGDIIVKADGQKITSLDDLYAVLNKHKAGDTITLTIYSQTSGQSNTTREVRTKLLEDKGETQK